MKTQTCRQCGEDRPTKEFVIVDKRRAKPYKRTICLSCRRAQKSERRTPRAKNTVPLVVVRPHYETIGPESVWPKGRLFFKGEFETGIEEGVWPAGMRVRDEKGRDFEVRLELRRL